MKVLITGIAGFAGSHLAELALREGAEVVGTVLPGTGFENLTAVQKDVATISCDLTAPGAAVRTFVIRSREDLQLAREAFVHL